MADVNPTNPRMTAPRRFSYRAAAVFAVAASFLAMTISGSVLLVAPSGRIAIELGWTLLGLSRLQWEVMHMAMAVVFLGVVLWHLLLHAAIVRNLVWSGTSHTVQHRRELAVAVGGVTLIVLIAVLDLPPASWLRMLAGFMRREFW